MPLKASDSLAAHLSSRKDFSASFFTGGGTVRTGLSVIAYVTAKAGQEERVRGALLELVRETRKERGCINYDLHQSEESAAEFAIYENWERPGDLEAHAQSAHLLAFRRNAAEMLEGPSEITKWKMISELRETHG